MKEAILHRIDKLEQDLVRAKARVEALVEEEVIFDSVADYASSLGKYVNATARVNEINFAIKQLRICLDSANEKDCNG